MVNTRTTSQIIEENAMPRETAYLEEILPILEDLRDSCSKHGFPLVYHVIRTEDEEQFQITSYYNAGGQLVPKQLAASYYVVTVSNQASEMASDLIIMGAPTDSTQSDN